jgi:hypothetical protein
VSLQSTLGDNVWVVENKDKIKELLPETWTHAQNINGLQLGYGLKLLGIDWRSEDEFAVCMVFLEKVGILLRDGLLIRRGRK